MKKLLIILTISFLSNSYAAEVINQVNIHGGSILEKNAGHQKVVIPSTEVMTHHCGQGRANQFSSYGACMSSGCKDGCFINNE